MQAMHRDWPVSTLETRMMTAGEIYYDDLLSVKAIPTTHLAGADGEVASYALAVDFSDKRLVYTGDLSADLGDLPRVLFEEPTDLCIMEVQHYEVRDALPLLAQCPIRKLVLTHVADRWSNDDEALLSALDLLPYPCAVAHDGDQFVV